MGQAFPGRRSANRSCAAQTAARGTCEYTVGMHHMHILFVAALGAFAGTRTRHQLGSRARRPELNYLTQEPSSVSSLQRLSLDSGERPESQPAQPDKALRVSLAI